MIIRIILTFSLIALLASPTAFAEKNSTHNWMNLYLVQGEQKIKFGYAHIKEEILSKKKRLQGLVSRTYTLGPNKNKYVLANTERYVHSRYRLVFAEKTDHLNQPRKAYKAKVKGRLILFQTVQGEQKYQSKHERQETVYATFSGRVLKTLGKLKLGAKGEIKHILDNQVVTSQFEVLDKRQVKVSYGEFPCFLVKVGIKEVPSYQAVYFVRPDGKDIQILIGQILSVSTTAQDAKKFVPVPTQQQAGNARANQPSPHQQNNNTQQQQKSTKRQTPYDALGKHLEKVLINKNFAAFQKYFDTDLFIAIVTQQQQISPQIKAGFKAALQNNFNIGKILASQAHPRYGIKFLRYVKTDNQPSLLFRLINPQGGVNYYNFILSERKGRLKIADAYIFLQGEFFSDTIRRYYLSLFSGQENKLGEQQQEFLAKMQQIALMQQMAQRQQFYEALQIYNRLPSKLKKEKSVLLLRIQYARQVNTKEFLKAVEDLALNYPNDPALKLVSIDAHILKGEYNKALQAVDEIDRLVGGDPYLHSLRAEVYKALDNDQAFEKAYLTLIAQEPQIDVAYLELIQHAMSKRNFDKAVQYLDLMHKNLGVDLKVLEQNPSFSEFVQSPQYKRWKRQQ